MVADRCPDENQLVDYLHGASCSRVDDARGDVIRTHLVGCAPCDELVAVLVRGRVPEPVESSVEPSELAPGTHLGRFVIGERLGAGAMGVVYAAQDPHLQRRVALKLVRRGATATPALASRLSREAQAMARLTHPNVAVVHECGLFGDEVFVAMELVEGETLASWVAAAPRGWREIVRVFVQAGRGLAAAHAVGIVHRDFKPSNVIVGRDGRVRVLDFGLARVDEEPAAGACGTPAYMAPEQRRREPAVEASDQYSFCVALHEALHGVRPPHVARALPRCVRAILERGLREHPEARFESMRALVDALRSTLRPRLRFIAILLVAASAMIVGAVVAVERTAGPSCAVADRHLTGIWDAETKREVHAAYRSTGRSFAEDAWRTTERALDAYAREWVEMRTSACRATHVIGDQTEAQLDRRVLCLDQRLQQFDAVVVRLRGADAQTVEKAVHAVHSLPSIDACADLPALSQAAPPPSTSIARVETARIRGILADAATMLALGKYAEGVPIAASASTAARALGYRPVEAEALWLLGRFHAYLGDYARSEALFHDAVRTAESSRHDELAAKAWIGLTAVSGLAKADFEHGLEVARYAQAAIERMGGHAECELSLAVNRARLFYYLRRRVEALAESYRALELAQRLRLGDHETVANVLELLAMLHSDLGIERPALAYYARARGMFERLYGVHHPEFGIALSGEGVVHLGLGDNATAERLGRQAVAVLEAAMGPRHPATAGALRLVGISLWDRRDWTAAIPTLERTLDLQRAALGPEHPDVGTTMGYLAACLLEVGRGTEALPLAASAFALARSARPSEASVRALATWSQALIATGSVELGVAKLEAAIAMLSEIPVPRLRAQMQHHLGLTRLAQGRARDAIAPLEQALAAAHAEDPRRPRFVAAVALELARALWVANVDRARARELGEVARASCIEHCSKYDEAAIETWLAARRARHSR